ncbi:hypothetical protein D3C72_1459790 [compost metagenome]
MKIDNSISSYYFSQRRAQSGSTAPIEENAGNEQKQRLMPTIAPPSNATSLSNAFWISATREEEAKPSITSPETDTSSGGTVSDEFLQQAKMNLAERIRARLLEALGLTEDDVKAMEPAKRAAFEEEVRKAVERAMGVEQQRDDTASDIAEGSPAA